MCPRLTHRAGATAMATILAAPPRAETTVVAHPVSDRAAIYRAYRSYAKWV